MELKKIQDTDLEGKKVILRVDFNVALEKGEVKEKYKIQACKESLAYLLARNAKVALLTYFGRPGGKKDLQYSLEQIRDDVENILGYKIKFVSDSIGAEVKKTAAELKGKEAVLLENVRFYSEEGDVEKGTPYDPEFAEKLADGFDIFINEAFSQSHRDQASITGIEKILPSYAGFWLQKEIENLDKIKNNPQRPAVAIIGGAKIETKLPVIKFFENIYDYVLVGGKIANEALDQKITFSEKVILPVDFADGRLDIGPETVKRFQTIIQKARTIVWNGPLGKFEEEKYSHGTSDIFQAILRAEAYKLAGGGETLEILEKNQAFAKFDFVSTGGGAMLEYLSGEKMPGIEILKIPK
jgi:phosphoglycerate kinase